MIQIAPSLLAADFLNLGDAVRMVNDYADLYHLDVMDGVFVPNISYGFPVIQAISAKATKPMDVHLMITDPIKYAARFARIPHVGMVSFHLDAAEDPAAVLAEIKAEGCKAGLVINPDIAVERLYPYLPLCDFVLIMGVFAGFGGQKFIEETVDRVAQLKCKADELGLENLEIEVDGGVSPTNSSALIKAGATILVAGTAVFKAESPAEVISAMKSL